MKWYRHPIELFLRWWRGYDEPDWRTRLLKPFLLKVQQPSVVTYQVGDVLETWEYRWASRGGKLAEGEELAGIHPIHDIPGRRMQLVRRRIR